MEGVSIFKPIELQEKLPKSLKDNKLFYPVEKPSDIKSDSIMFINLP